MITYAPYREAEDAANGDYWDDYCGNCGAELSTSDEREAGECRECALDRARRDGEDDAD